LGDFCVVTLSKAGSFASENRSPIEHFSKLNKAQEKSNRGTDRVTIDISVGSQIVQSK
jgi:hypothetical protein